MFSGRGDRWAQTPEGAEGRAGTRQRASPEDTLGVSCDTIVPKPQGLLKGTALRGCLVLGTRQMGDSPRQGRISQGGAAPEDTESTPCSPRGRPCAQALEPSVSVMDTSAPPLLPDRVLSRLQASPGFSPSQNLETCWTPPSRRPAIRHHAPPLTISGSWHLAWMTAVTAE